jgi:tRNA modification GTPase
LELDFSEEDVEFANRDALDNILQNIDSSVKELKSSFALGNVLKNGVSVAIIGEPNAGKSTLLNTLVGDDCAMVSDIAGTTRDAIEATTTIDGVRFRFIDTAGIRTTDDKLEKMGIDRAMRAIDKAHIILHVAPVDNLNYEDIIVRDNQHYIRVINKIDQSTSSEIDADSNTLTISAKYDIGITELKMRLRSIVDTSHLSSKSVVVTNMRHYAALSDAAEALNDVRCAMYNGLSADLIAEDVRRVIHHIGEITGEITSDDILHSIFSKFCIGK